MNNLIGVCGQKHNGKDKTAEYLVKNHSYVQVGFADPIKDGLMKMFDLSWEQVYGDLKEVIDSRYGITPRKLMQITGGDLYQVDIHKYLDKGEFPFGRKIWVRVFELWYQKQLIDNPTVKVVINDLRHVHEAEYIKEIGGVIWKVKRPSVKSNDTHLSENEIDLIVEDELIINDEGLNELYNKIENLVRL
jgi:hypothetical protein